MNRELLRNKLIQLKREKGVNYVFVARSINVSRTTISLFINNKRDISDSIANELTKFLKGTYITL